MEGTRVSKNPIKAIFDFKREELPVVLLMFLFSFFVIAIFQILKPLKKGLFLEAYGADIELYAKLLNVAVAAFGVIAFTFLYNKLPRQRLIYSFCLFFTASFLALVFLLDNPHPAVIWGFYILGDLVTTLLVPCFWAYLTDISSPIQAKRLFGLMGAGLAVGGVFGSTLNQIYIQKLGQQFLMLISAILMVLVLIITFLAESLVRRTETFGQALPTEPPKKEPVKRESKLAAAIEGAKLALRSKYLAAIVGIMALYEIASQLMEYLFSKAAEILPGTTVTQSFINSVYLKANVIAAIVQIFLVSFIIRRLGLSFALCVLPVAAIASSGGYLFLPSLTTAALLIISDNGLNYSLQQTARETLYVPTTPDEKYKARAFTNMFVQRLAKGIAILGIMGVRSVGVSFYYIALVAIVVLVSMGLLGIYEGRRFNEMTSRGEYPRQGE